MGVIQIPDDFQWVLMCMLTMVVQLMIQGYTIVPLRAKLFNEKFFSTNFPKVAYKEYHMGGYPDMGSGVFSEKLAFEDWIRFNSYQRSHYHYVENIAVILVLTFICGLYSVPFTVCCSLFYILGRDIYCRGYRIGGPNGRLPGAYILAIVNFLMICFAGYNLYMDGGGYAGALNLIPQEIQKAFLPRDASKA